MRQVLSFLLKCILVSDLPCASQTNNGNQTIVAIRRQVRYISVAPHYFKEADMEQLTTGDKKMPNAKAVGSSGAAAS
jgi:pre-mRNA-splicing factor ATP-dependent RNA helicase DHX16